ncbi:MAG: hypothetical protein K2Y21_13200 [Phycisphaerales bacterium]|nr:hypothetical protein [Phycisphaerales bacterium]
MNRKLNVLTLTLVAGLAAPAFAQDSISKNGDGGSGLPGDAFNWADGNAQRSRYAVDSQKLTTSWGVTFGIVPLVKTDRPVNPALGQSSVFFNNLFGTFGVSKTLRTTNFRNNNYLFWQAPAAGSNAVQNDQSLNSPDLNPSGASYQFGTYINQFGTASAPAGASAVNSSIGAVVNYAPDNIRRFFVERVLLASSNPTGGTTANNGALFASAADSNGQFYLRADNNGGNNPTTTARILGNNVARVNALTRSGSINTLGGAGGLTTASDAAATQFVLNNYNQTASIPSALPASLATGGNGRYLGPDFARQYAYEAIPGATTFVPSTASYLTVLPGGANNDHRGAIAVHPKALFGGSSVAAAAILGRDGNAGSNNNYIVLWGLNGDAGITAGKVYGIPGPANVSLVRAPASDNSPAGPAIFDTTTAIPATMSGFFAYHQGSTAFQGPSSQIALGQDLAGRGLIAGLYYENVNVPSDTTPTPNVAIVVGRFDPNNPTGTIQWKTVAWTYATGTAVADTDGTPIRGDWGNNGHSSTSLASAGQFDKIVDLNPSSPTYDRPIGRLQASLSFPGPSVTGAPSITPPAIDAVGNIWFVASTAINTYSTTTQQTFSRYNNALIRAVYNPDTFSYDLELVAEFGDRFTGKNSLTRYSIGGLVRSTAAGAPSSSAFNSSAVAPYADRNLNVNAAIGSGDLTTWGANGAVVDPRSLGGLVLGANWLYDVNGDNSFQDPSGTAPSNPNSPDEQYSGLLYIHHRSCDADLNGDGVVDDSDFVIFAGAYNNLLDTFADFNFDNITDDSDFVIFAGAYNDLLCSFQPGSN